MITYNDIYEALRKEKYAEQLQPLDKKFIIEVAEYFRDKKSLSEKEDPFSETAIKTKKQIENAISIFKELMMRRRRKMLNLAFVARETGLSKRDSDCMLDFESSMFDSMIKCLEETDKKLLELMNGKNEKDNRNIMILFKESVEAFLGIDGEMLGPFDKGEMANLPEQISKILTDSGKAEMVE